MTGEISLDIGADVRGAVKGIKDVGDELEKVSADLSDVDSVGGDTSRSLEQDFRDISRAARNTTDDVERVGSDGFRRLKDSGVEAGTELRANLGETFASFRGDLADLPQLAQDTLAGLAGSGALGGIPGLAVTAAGAAGLGLIIGAFESINQANEESQARIGEWAESFITAGNRVLSSAQIVAGAQDILSDPEKFKEASRNAELWGVNVETAILAVSGHAGSIDVVTRAVDAQREALEKLDNAPTENYEERERARQAYLDSAGALNHLTDEMDAGRARADILSAALRNVAETTAGATTKVDEFGDYVTNLPDGTTIYVDAETGQATTDIEAVENKAYSANVTAHVRPEDSELKNYRPPTFYAPVRLFADKFSYQALGG